MSLNKGYQCSDFGDLVSSMTTFSFSVHLGLAMVQLSLVIVQLGLATVQLAFFTVQLGLVEDLTSFQNTYFVFHLTNHHDDVDRCSKCVYCYMFYFIKGHPIFTQSFHRSFPHTMIGKYFSIPHSTATMDINLANVFCPIGQAKHQ